jgi:putative nucleotidyltransferase with HDIG domain
MSLNAPQAAIPADLPGESPHYIRSVTELGDTEGVIVSNDIFAVNGMKLIAAGSRISSSQFERLTAHRLAVPLDQSLVAEKPVDGAVLAMEATKIIESDAIYRRLTTRAGDPLGIRHGLTNLKIPTVLQTRLTVMRERRNEIYMHSLRTAIIADCLAQRMRLREADRNALLLAALFHDVGEMHTDPRLLAEGHDITTEERRFVHVHPVTSYVLVNELPGFPANAAQAILHHHERLDGSGYPNDLPNTKIPPLARLIAVADVAEAVIKRFDLPRLDMLFRLNQARFDPVVVNALRDLIHITPEDAVGVPQEQGAAAQLAHLAALLGAWFSVRAALQQPEQAQGGATPRSFLFERMTTICHLVVQAGFDPDNMESMLAIARDDPQILIELRGMLDEMDWLMRDLVHEMDRRSPELVGLSQGALKGLTEHLRPPGRR